MEKEIREIRKITKKLIGFVNTNHKSSESIEDWEYLIHHIEIVEGEEELHHCFMLDHLGNKYEIGHIMDEDDNQRHCILGLVEDQDVYWSDTEAVEAGETIPCPGRQLE